MQKLEFPADFEWGCASSGYQVEGGHDKDGKGPSIWDHALHERPELVVDGSNGDVACDSYHKWEEDVEMLKYLGVHYYRFAFSWPRIMPTGRADKINEAGVKFYHKCLDSLLQNQIEPRVTLFHWDTPQALEVVGGWMDPKMVDYFAEYAEFCFKEFGSKVKLWITLNEPMMFFRHAYEALMVRVDEPNFEPNRDRYLVMYHMLKAHATAYRIYERSFKAIQKGMVGLTYATHAYKPFSKAPDDLKATERAQHFDLGLFYGPLVHGDYHEIVRTSVAKRSQSEGYPKSSLPVLTLEDKCLIKGALDYIGVNFYTGALVQDRKDQIHQSVKGFPDDRDVITVTESSWPRPGNKWQHTVKWCGRRILKFIKAEYGDHWPIYIMENGCMDSGDKLDDHERIHYLKTILLGIHKGITKDKVNLKAYTYWTLMDNFEWLDGYTTKFGLYHVDFKDPDRKRTAKKSAEFYKNLVENNSLEI